MATCGNRDKTRRHRDRRRTSSAVTAMPPGPAGPAASQ
jgi:hypothetical protein